MSKRPRIILAWIFGVFVLLMGVSALGRQPVGGLLLLIAGGLLLPPVATRLSGKLTTRRRIALAIVLLIVGAGLSPAKQQSTQSPAPQPEINVVRQPAATSSREKTPFVYDIPSLFGKKYPEVKAIFGKTIETDRLGDEKTEAWFAKKGYELGVDYNPETNEVTGFFLSPDERTGPTKDIELLMDIGNLSSDDPNYSVEPVPLLNDPSSYTGIKVQTKAASQAAASRANAVKNAEQYNAYAMTCAQQEVKAMLKAPSTAQFPWGSANVLYSPETGTFDVISYVDAENSFGAMLRTNYLCNVVDLHETGACSARCRLE